MMQPPASAANPNCDLPAAAAPGRSTRSERQEWLKEPEDSATAILDQLRDADVPVLSTPVAYG